MKVITVIRGKFQVFSKTFLKNFGYALISYISFYTFQGHALTVCLTAEFKEYTPPRVTPRHTLSCSTIYKAVSGEYLPLSIACGFGHHVLIVHW